MNESHEKLMTRGRPVARLIQLAVVGSSLLGAAAGCGDPAPDAEDHSAHDEPAAADAEPVGADAEPMVMEEGGEEPSMESSGRGAVHLTTEQERALGVTYTDARRTSMTRTIRTVGRIDAAEPSIADVTPKIEGFVERLFVSSTGQAVRRGEPLLTIYSPALVAAQEELLTARRLAASVRPDAGEAYRNAQSMLDAARRRLVYWDITEDQILQLEESGEVTKTMTLVAPVSGIVLEKDVFEGQRTMPGMRLYRIADLSTVWVEGEVFERDLQFVQTGSQAHIEVAAYPGEHLMGMVSFVYPTVEVESRTNRVRVTVSNPGLRLKPGMYVTVFFDVDVIQDDIAIPLESVVVTGERNLVFVRDQDGMLNPREVVLGSRAGDYVQILEGLVEGETIVASANFLVDAESRLESTGGGMPGMQHAGHGSAIEPVEPDTIPASGHEEHND